MALVAAILFFSCLLLHELGHAAVARREGMEIEGITLWVFGGVARFKGMFPSAGAEFRIAVAGPLVSLALGVLLVALALAVPLPAAVNGVVSWLGWINLLLLAFNMLPALPLDGGRVLRSLLWQRMGDFSRATRIAGGLGRGFGHSMIVADPMVPDPAVATGEASLDAFMAGEFARSRHSWYPIVEEGRIVGAIAFRAVAAIPEGERGTRRVRDAMVPLSDLPVFAPGDPLFQAAVELMQSRSGRGLVVARGRLVGLLTVSDLSRLLELRRLTGARRRLVHV